MPMRKIRCETTGRSTSLIGPKHLEDLTTVGGYHPLFLRDDGFPPAGLVFGRPRVPIWLTMLRVIGTRAFVSKHYTDLQGPESYFA